MYVRTYWGCLVVVTCADFICVPFHPFIPAVDAGLIGLSLSYTISLAALLQHGVRQAAEVESLVSSECSPITAMQVPRLGVYLSQVKMLLCCSVRVECLHIYTHAYVHRCYLCQYV